MSFLTNGRQIPQNVARLALIDGQVWHFAFQLADPPTVKGQKNVK